ncbi:MAG: hypothetical protein ORN49_13510 [Rhodobacteraceae bacterium]|nr:hypothetical protein [Paracoccaceae bacterium]
MFHLGCHASDESRLFRSILNSRAALTPNAVGVPGPRTYRLTLPEAMAKLNGDTASEEMQQNILETVLKRDALLRALFFHDNLLCLPEERLSEAGLYAKAPEGFSNLLRLFPDHETVFSFALCNPATVIAFLVQRQKVPAMEALITPDNALKLRWLPTMTRVMLENPELRLTVWCNEDAPLIWPEILRTLSGLGQEVPHAGDLDMVAALMSPDGFNALTEDLVADPPHDISAWRERISLALRSDAKAELMEVEIPMPGWTDELVAEVTELYRQDCLAIAELPGVTFLSP